MDHQLFDFMRDRFDGLDQKLDEAKTSFDEHAATDARYWRVLDEQQAQLSLIKRLLQGAGVIGSIVGSYLGFKH